MHKIMVGMRIDVHGQPQCFGWDEVNDYLRHGMRIVRLEPGECFRCGLDEGNTEKDQLMIWYFSVILDDYGIDPP